MNTKQFILFPQTPELKRRSKEDRPVYRLERLGPQALSNAEILAAIIRGPNCLEVARSTLDRFQGWANLHRATIHDLQGIYGIGLEKAATIQAAFELGRRAVMESPEEPPSIHSPADAASLVQYEMSVLEKEELRTILLNTRNQVQDIVTVYKGSLNSSQVRVGELFTEAIRRVAAAIIVVHNHPSGDPSPSPDDIALTRAIVQAGQLLDIDVLDHIVIGQGRFVSLKERGLGFG
jgi:DNA repair protein RadC